MKKMFCVPSLASVRRKPAAIIPERMQFTLACVICGRPIKRDLQITIGLRSNKITPNSRWGNHYDGKAKGAGVAHCLVK
tara:strand:- start:247 stop:483 length:237 start_codon:yes stop_codon:yes gene_type:complete